MLSICFAFANVLFTLRYDMPSNKYCIFIHNDDKVIFISNIGEDLTTGIMFYILSISLMQQDDDYCKILSSRTKPNVFIVLTCWH